ncbi:MAG TPA: hypothetical protein VOA87_11925 [Thermoanaerobaculia bacterium]|nr:hypothetical protein [Thermoanaerobaculia bacterium]
MRTKVFALSLALLAAGLAAAAQTPNSQGPEWPQWGQNQEHAGSVNAVGQAARHVLADVVYDPFVQQEMNDPLAAPDLLVHYQVPLIDGDDVYMEFKTGTYTSISTWETQIWNEKRLHWDDGELETEWNFQSDWKPVPYGTALFGPAWEPVFHAALSGSYVYVPGFGGSIYKLNKSNGAVVAHVTPFGSHTDPDIFTTGPLTADANGNVYYDTIKLSHGNPWESDVVNSWLVKVAANGTVTKATITSLTVGAPAGNAQCPGVFTDPFPWPPSPNAVAPTVQCGTQRVAINMAPAVAPDGTVYIASVAHLTSRTAYLVAVNPNLTPKWHASLRERFHDGCNVQEPPNGTPGGCSVGAHTGVDPAENKPGSGRIIEDATSSPVVGPDGSVFLGVYTRYNYAQGHLMKFSANGTYLAGYIFGWDDTPGIYAHGGTYSLATKDNRYGGTGSYCNDDAACPPDRTPNNPGNPEEYFVTQLSKNLTPEWMWQNTNTLSCTRNPDGSISCVSDHPAGFEWCVNAPAIDSHGVVYANSEDGGLYTINQGGTLKDHLFLDLALGAAYTPISLGRDGKIYTQNEGHLFVVGN